MTNRNAAADSETEAWAVVVRSLLRLVPADKRTPVLQIAAQEQAEADRDRASGKLLKRFTLDDAFLESPGFRHWDLIMRLKSAVVYTFIRNIVGHHSPEDAARLLFKNHRRVPGSGWLPDYLARLPAIRIDRDEAARISDEASA